VFRPLRDRQAVDRLGYSCWITGHKDKAEFYFDAQKRICEESIKLNRENGAKAYYDFAGIYAIRGEKENILIYLFLQKFNKSNISNHEKNSGRDSHAFTYRVLYSRFENQSTGTSLYL